MHSALFAISLALMLSADAARKMKPRVELPQKPINWNLSFYKEPFAPCKTLRPFNPVEQVRAHGVAVEVFQKCGPRLIVPYAVKYSVPAYAIMRAGEIFCLIFNTAGGYFDLYGQLRVETYDNVDDMLSLLRKFCDTFAKAGDRNFVVKHGNETFRFTSAMCHGFIHDVVECGLKRVGLRNVEAAKYTVGHFMKMLL